MPTNPERDEKVESENSPEPLHESDGNDLIQAGSSDRAEEFVEPETTDVEEEKPLEDGETEPQLHKASYAERLGAYFDERDGAIRLLSVKQRNFRTRRDLLLFGAGAVASAAALRWVLPATTQIRMGYASAVDMRPLWIVTGKKPS